MRRVRHTRSRIKKTLKGIGKDANSDAASADSDDGVPVDSASASVKGDIPDVVAPAEGAEALPEEVTVDGA